jgi:hypothetical protein
VDARKLQLDRAHTAEQALNAMKPAIRQLTKTRLLLSQMSTAPGVLDELARADKALRRAFTITNLRRRRAERRAARAGVPQPVSSGAKKP